MLPTGSILHSPSPGELLHAELQWLWWRELQFIFNQPIPMFWGTEQTDGTLIWNLSSQIWSLVLNYFITKQGREWGMIQPFQSQSFRDSRRRKQKHPFRFHHQVPFANTETCSSFLVWLCSGDKPCKKNLENCSLYQLSLSCFYLTYLHVRCTGLFMNQLKPQNLSYFDAIK